MKDAAKIAVIVPCYNQAQYLDQALASVYGQTFADWQCFIVNDGSTDHCADVAQKWTAKDPRFRYLEKQNGGLGSARAHGIAHSQSTYVFPLDADDWIADGYFESAVKILDSLPEVEIVHCNVMQFGSIEGPFVLQPYDYQTLLQKNCIIACAFFRRASYDRTRGYDKTMHMLEDWDLWLSLLQHGGVVHKLESFYYHYRRHTQGSLVNSFSTNRDNYLRHVDQVYKNHIDAYLKHWGNPILSRRELLDQVAWRKKTQASLLYRLYQLPRIVWQWLKRKK